MPRLTGPVELGTRQRPARPRPGRRHQRPVWARTAVPGRRMTRTKRGNSAARSRRAAQRGDTRRWRNSKAQPAARTRSPSPQRSPPRSSRRTRPRPLRNPADLPGHDLGADLHVELPARTGRGEIRADDGVLCRANSGLPSGHGVTAGTRYPRASHGRAATAAGMGTSAGRATLKELFIPAEQPKPIRGTDREDRRHRRNPRRDERAGRTRQTQAELQSEFPGWRIWYVYRPGKVSWAARPEPLLNTQSAEDLRAAIAKVLANDSGDVSKVLEDIGDPLVSR